MFHEIGGLNVEDVEITAMAHILSKIDEYAFAVEIVDLAVSGRTNIHKGKTGRKKGCHRKTG